MPSAMLGSDRQVTSLTQLLRVLAKWREKNGAKMTSRSRQKFPAQMSETKRVSITLPSFCFLIPADLTPKEDFEQLYNFQGPVISECTIVLDFLCSNVGVQNSGFHVHELIN